MGIAAGHAGEDEVALDRGGVGEARVSPRCNRAFININHAAAPESADPAALIVLPAQIDVEGLPP